jgi:hypothetical protein
MLVGGLDGTAQFVDVQTSPSFKAGAARVLFKARRDVIGFTVSDDLQRFVEVVPVGAAAPNNITLVLNWMAGLERK